MIGSDHDSVGSPLKGKWPSQRGTHGNKGAFWIWSGKTPARGAILHLFCFTVGYFYIFFYKRAQFSLISEPRKIHCRMPSFCFQSKMDTWCLLLLGILCCLNGVQTLTCPSGFQSTILGTCADTNECQGSAPCSKGTCMNTNGNHYCDDSQSIDKNNQTVCGSVTCNNFANCVNNTNTCICQPGYTGPTCSVQLSCDKMCRNNGTCDFQGIEEVCICSEGFTGSECQYSLNICNNQSQSVCLNNGTCAFGQFDSFPSCSCSGSYEGLFCEASNCSTLCYPSNKDASCGGSCPCNSTYYGNSNYNVKSWGKIDM